MSQPITATPIESQDALYLKALSVTYYVFVGLDVLAIAFTVGYAALMTHLMPEMQTPSSPAQPDMFLWLLKAALVANVVINLVSVVLHLMTARRLRERRGAKFCQIVAALTCLSFPLGTVLGAFTLIALGRPSMKALFQARS